MNNSSVSADIAPDFSFKKRSSFFGVHSINELKWPDRRLQLTLYYYFIVNIYSVCLIYNYVILYC